MKLPAKEKKPAAKTSARKRASAVATKKVRPEKALRHAVVLGAGRMGADIAMALAMGGWKCDVIDPGAGVRERTAPYWKKELRRLDSTSASKRMRLHPSPENIDWPTVDLVVESVPEDMKLKHAVLKQIEPLVRPQTIIATNTSSLRISDVTGVLKHPGRGAGFHLSVPAHIMLAVEITKGEKSAPKTVKKLADWAKALGKVPIVINRDVPGMLINRLQHAMYREIYHLIDTGVATPHDIDCAVRFGFGFKYNIVGPVFSRDIHGIPVHLATAKQLYPTLYNGRKPSKTLSRLVRQGHHGVTTGQGFYKWPKATTAKRLEEFASLLNQSLTRIKRVGEPSDF